MSGQVHYEENACFRFYLIKHFFFSWPEYNFSLPGGLGENSECLYWIYFLVCILLQVHTTYVWSKRKNKNTVLELNIEKLH